MIEEIFFDEDHPGDLDSNEDNPGCEECGNDATVKTGGKYDTVYLCDVCAEVYEYMDDDEF